jgi:hypothetical protein
MSPDRFFFSRWVKRQMSLYVMIICKISNKQITRVQLQERKPLVGFQPLVGRLKFRGFKYRGVFQ